MAIIQQAFSGVAVAVKDTLDGMGDSVDVPAVTIVDDTDPGVIGAAAHEALAPLPGEKQAGGIFSNSVIIMTSNLARDDNEMRNLLGAPPGFVGHESQTDEALRKRFSTVTIAPMSADVLKKVAERMIAERKLDEPLKEKLRNVTDKAIDETDFSKTGARGLRKMIDGYALDLLEREREREQIAQARTAQVIGSLCKGTTRRVAAPKTARFKGVS